MPTDLIVDEGTFTQLLEIDDYEFAKGIIDEFFEQAYDILAQFDRLFEQRDWKEVGKLGHHLKGSSAAVGAAEVRDICDRIQHYETIKDEELSSYLERQVTLLKSALPVAKRALYELLMSVAK